MRGRTINWFRNLVKNRFCNSIHWKSATSERKTKDCWNRWIQSKMKGWDLRLIFNIISSLRSRIKIIIRRNSKRFREKEIRLRRRMKGWRRNSTSIRINIHFRKKRSGIWKRLGIRKSQTTNYCWISSNSRISRTN